MLSKQARFLLCLAVSFNSLLFGMYHSKTSRVIEEELACDTFLHLQLQNDVALRSMSDGAAQAENELVASMQLQNDLALRSMSDGAAQAENDLVASMQNVSFMAPVAEHALPLFQDAAQEYQDFIASMDEQDVVALIRRSDEQHVKTFCELAPLKTLLHVAEFEQHLYERKDVGERIEHTDAKDIREFLLDAHESFAQKYLVNALDQKKFQEVIHSSDLKTELRLSGLPAVQARLTQEARVFEKCIASGRKEALQARIDEMDQKHLLALIRHLSPEGVTAFCKNAPATPFLNVCEQLPHLFEKEDVRKRILNMTHRLSGFLLDPRHESLVSAYVNAMSEKEFYSALRKNGKVIEERLRTLPAVKDRLSQKKATLLEDLLGNKKFCALVGTTPVLTHEHGRQSIVDLHEHAEGPHFLKSVNDYNANCVSMVDKTACFRADCYMRIGINNKSADIQCLPSQEFKIVSQDNKWRPAIALNVGDRLLSRDGQEKIITTLEFVKEPIDVYAISIEQPHNFYIGNEEVLTHNMLIEVGLSIGFGEGLALSAAAGGGATVVSGPIGGALVTFAVGGAIFTVYTVQNLVSGGYEYSLGAQLENIFERGDKKTKKPKAGDGKGEKAGEAKEEKKGPRNLEPQAPSMPTEEDGFKKPKKFDGKKKRHQKTGQYGWEDSKGVLWVPVNDHGGFHWDRIYADGKHDNLHPGGKVRAGTRN